MRKRKKPDTSALSRAARALDMGWEGGVTRVEHVDLSADLRLKDLEDPRVALFKDIIEEGTDAVVNMVGEGDVLEVTYHFQIEYFNQVEKRLKAWVDLIKSGIVVKADFKRIGEYKLKSLRIVQLVDQVLALLRKSQVPELLDPAESEAARIIDGLLILSEFYEQDYDVVDDALDYLSRVRDEGVPITLRLSMLIDARKAAKEGGEGHV